MKMKFMFMCFLLTMTSCFVDKYEEGPFLSPTKNYTLIAKVDDMDEESENYAELRLVVINKNGQAVDSVETGASDFSKWAAGWMNHGDTIVLHSSDIGPRAYSMLTGELQEITLFPDTIQSRIILRQARELKEKKYKE
jgi:hypothetical protein